MKPIRSLAEMAYPPLRLQLGSDCMPLVQAKLNSVAQVLELTHHVAVSTDFPG